MFCGNCGKDIPDHSTFCPYCSWAIPDPRAQNRSKAIMSQSFTGGSVHQSISNNVIMRHAEKALRLWSVTLEERSRGQDGLEDPDRVVLLATNQRLILLQRRGRFNVQYDLLDSIDYANVHGLTIGGMVVKRMELNFESNGRLRKWIVTALRERDLATLEKKGITTAQELQHYIRSMSTERILTLQEERNRDRIHYVLDFSFLKMELQKGGVVINTIRCPSCGASIGLPDSGSQIQCNYCGSNVQAQDIFEKMKGLIGGL